MPGAISGFTIDIVGPGSELDRLRAENVRLRATVESLEGLHRDLLAVISHELRTPLTVIQGLAEIMLDAPGREVDGPEYLGQILKACDQLARLVDRSITLARLQSGQLSPVPDALGLREAVDRVIGRFADAIGDKALIFVRRFPADLPPVWMDGLCLDAVLAALVENAVKFNRAAGRVYLSARYRRGGVELRIRNTGEGIPADSFKQIFQLFEQVDSGHTRRYSGLGLGLPLAKRLLDLAGARIAVSSPGLGRGACFTLALPPAPEPQTFEGWKPPGVIDQKLQGI